MTDVVAALIWDDCRFLACQRPAHKKRGLLWEFVGGKKEASETLEEALIRECQEELDITVLPEHIFMQVIHEYPDITIRLSLFNAVITKGEPKLLEHNDMQWMKTDKLDPNTFCPADKDILAVLSRIHNHLEAELYAMRDEKYKDFTLSLIPGYSADRFLGVRMPTLRKYAKRISSISGLGELPHPYYEEDCLHALIINRESNFVNTIEMLDAFLPCVDNWAVCDLLAPISFRNKPAQLLCYVKSWLISDHPYTVRFGIGVLRKYFLDNGFDPEQMHWVAGIRADHYYVKMMIAWYFATALDKQCKYVMDFLNTQTLDPWVHNKTIQKACESFRISDDMKAKLRLLKISRK